LIMMVLVAGFQAFIRNLTRFHDAQWANDLLMDMEWADSFLRKGTLWLAFLGASLATQKHKQIAIDVLLRLAPPRGKYWMLAISGVLAGLITFGLTFSFWQAVKLNLSERPVEYEIIGDNGPMHVCDATAAQLHALDDMARPTFFCPARSVLSLFGVHAETPGSAFQLIVPVMFFVIAMRLFFYGFGYVRIATGDEAGIEEAEAEEVRRLLAQQESSRGETPKDATGAKS
jgi:TRAP-type C4-dicarboxylate transport system permease small subunit